ncbi:MAG TPA: Gfo/Idh/MocA family oxidoreductase [Bacteroidales bacterium]|nr:Gfo/Idh/MocA family oxidoreductase [Bacteroidales bacterium]
MSKNFNRRKFIKTSILGSIGVSALGKDILAESSQKQDKSVESKPKQKKQYEKDAPKLRVGFIGVGLRGRSSLNLVLRREDCIIPCVADPEPKAIESTMKMFDDAGQTKPVAYQNGDYDYLNMLDKEKLDAVIISSPWTWHSRQSIAAMNRGLYTGCEVSGAFSLEQCWQLVNTHESTGSHFFFLENVCYRRDVMTVLNMVRNNVFGELIHLECGYQHDLRDMKFNDGKTVYSRGSEFGEKAVSEAKWRTIHSLNRNGDLYPTHGVGPVMNYIDINRGNRFVYLVSMASKARGLHEYLKEVDPDHSNAQLEWKLGDVVTTLIHCNNGEKVIVSHDTNLPRPYSLGFRVQGTKGLWMDVNGSVHIEGVSEPHRRDKQQSWFEKYDHPLWKRYENDAAGAGHGGMDWFLINAFVESAKKNEAPPIDVYDAATMLSITTLSEKSITMGSAPMTFPDFTNGRWISKKPNFGLSDLY